MNAKEKLSSRMDSRLKGFRSIFVDYAIVKHEELDEWLQRVKELEAQLESSPTPSEWKPGDRVKVTVDDYVGLNKGDVVVLLYRHNVAKNCWYAGLSAGTWAKWIIKEHEAEKVTE